MLQEWWGCLPHPLLSHPPSRWYTHVLLGACPRTDANDRRARSLQDCTNIQRYALSLVICVELCELVVNEGRFYKYAIKHFLRVQRSSGILISELVGRCRKDLWFQES